MYQALYRKYRPATFDDVVGQDVIIKTLKNAIKNNRIAHAYLFTGPRGTGKTSTAKILAKTVNCECLENFVPCDHCPSCVQINEKQSTDIVEIDAASNNGVDEIRELKSKVNLAPSTSKYKIYIIDEVHMLSTGAFNALLKTLEEPPSHIIFILATTEPHKIPQTILSRCQRFDFKKITIDGIKLNLEKICKNENIEISDEALYEIAYLSDGGMRDSVGLLDQAIAYCENNITIDAIHEINGTVTVNEIYELVMKMMDGNLALVLNQFDYYDSQGKNMIKLLEEVVEFLKNALVYKIDVSLFENDNYKELYEKTSSIFEKSQIINYIKKIFATISEMKNSENDRVVLELNLIDMLTVKKNNCVENTQNDFSLKIEKEGNEKKNDDKIEKNAAVDNKEKNNDTNLNSSKNECFQPHLAPKVNEKLKNIRINNSLALFDKRKLVTFKGNIDKLKGLLLDEKVGKLASLVLDGELKVLGREYLVFVYQDDAMTELFNQNLAVIDAMMQQQFHELFKCIAVNFNEWNVIRQEFNSKKKVYSYIEENETVLNDNKITNVENKNVIDTLFNDIIEYSN